MVTQIAVAREREIAMREILNAINNCRDDDAPVFDAILKNAAQLCDSPTATLLLLNDAGDRLILKAIWGDPLRHFKLEEHGVPIDGPAMPAESVRESRIVIIDDMADTDAYRSNDRARRKSVDEEGIRSGFSVPLMKDGKAFGCIDLFRREVRPFEPQHVELVESFAVQAVIAIDNVCQFREVQQRLEREAATKEVLQIISESRDDEQPVFEAILERACKLCEAPSAGLLLGTREDKFVTFAASAGTNKKVTDALRAAIVPMDADASYSARAIIEGKLYHLEDMGQGDLYQSGADFVRNNVDDLGIRSVIFVPLMAQHGALGAIALFREEVQPFNTHQIELVESFAAQATIAIENVRQYREVQERLEREKASRNILEVISCSRETEDPVFDAILENASSLCEADSAALMLTNEERSHNQLRRKFGRQLIATAPIQKWPLDSGHAHTESVRRSEVVHEPDLKQTDLYTSGDQTRIFLVDEVGLRSVLSVPLLRNGEAIGAIVLHRLDVARAFTDNDIRLVESFAAQAVIAIENVRQFRELQTRLEREAATREILEVISRSRGDDKPVFDAILKQAAQLCRAPFSFLAMVTNDGAHIEIKAEGAEPFEPFRPGWQWPVNSALLVARSVRERAVLQIEDTTLDPLYDQGNEDRVAVVKAGIRTVLTAPLVVGGLGIGSINLFRSEQRPFTPDEIALVQTFAEQAVIAIENVRQFRELQTRLEREAATREILSVISQSRDDDIPVFNTLLENAARLCDAPMARLHLVDENRTHHQMVAVWGEALKGLELGQTWPLTSNLPIPDSINGNKAILIDDFAKTKYYSDDNVVIRNLVDEEGFRSFAVVPLLKDGVAIGCITLTRRTIAPFATDDIALVETFAAQAVIAIENVRQFREVQERLEREAASREILSVISQSRDDNAPVFEAILENAARLCNAPVAWLMLADDDRKNFVFTAVHGDELQTMRIGESFPLDSPYMIAEAIREARTTEIPDLIQTESYRNREPIYVKLVEEENLRTRINVPLLQNDIAIGCIVLSRHEPERFSPDEIALVETFASQSVIAIENVRQFRELQTQLEQQTATAEVLKVISQSAFDLPTVLQALIDTAARLCDASICILFNKVGDELHLGANTVARQKWSSSIPRIRTR